MEAHPFEVMHYVVSNNNLLLHWRQTQACLDDPTSISMCGQLNSEVHEPVIECFLKVLVVVSLEISKNNLNDIVAVLIVAQIDELTVFEAQNFLIEPRQLFAFSTES